MFETYFSILEYSRKILPICFFVDHCNLLMLIKYVTDTHVAVGCSLQHTTNSPPVGVLQLTTILASGCFQFPFLLQLQSDWTAIKVQTKLPIFEKTLSGRHETRRVDRFKLRRDVEPLTLWWPS